MIPARVGFPEGPQVPDPRVPEWKDALDKHVSWWTRVIDQRKKEGWEIFTITPEFGPYPYMTILPFSKMPIADQWEVNLFMMEYLKDHNKPKDIEYYLCGPPAMIKSGLEILASLGVGEEMISFDEF